MAALAGVFAAVYGSVLVSELIGDKSIYSVTSLALKFPRAVVAAAIVAAYTVKMGCAVLGGELLARFPERILAAVSAAGFLAGAVVVALEKDEAREGEIHWRRGALACFAPLFIAEWADPGQMVVVAAAASTARPLAVWLAGSSAMITKGLLALLFGVQLRRRVPQRILRTVAAASLTLLSVATVAAEVFR